MKKSLQMAEQQLLGFHHRNVGFDIESLVSSMGLTKTEFEELKNEEAISYLTEDELEEIENYFSNQSNQ